MTQLSLLEARDRTPVRAYVGQTRSRELVAQLQAAGIGECVTRGQLPPRRPSWFYDNGAFEDFRQGQAFGVSQFMRDMRRIRMHVEAGAMTAPDFVVVPDVVAGGAASLAFSLEWLDLAKATGAPCYLAVQDGMTVDQVEAFILAHGFDGIFVGGSLDWKLATAGAWVALGAKLELPVHVGRVGTYDRVLWARELGVTSIDSSFPLWTDANMASFLEALTEVTR